MPHALDQTSFLCNPKAAYSICPWDPEHPPTEPEAHPFFHSQGPVAPNPGPQEEGLTWARGRCWMRKDFLPCPSSCASLGETSWWP